ncbi:MAG: helix-turn-helix transcriptional regulator [Bacteroidaceae bacterium]|nr:helix-turn-helix transcriptional regulator [Bacteroidaceae bacterium]
MTKQELQYIIGNNLRRCRKVQNFTREQLAEKVGISTTFYANLESGNKMMSLVTLQKMAEVLHVSTDSLLHSDDTDGKAKNIDLLLRDQSPDNLAIIEQLVRVCVNELPNNINCKEVLAQNEYASV